MKITVVVVGRVRGPLAEVVSDYEARAGRYWKLEIREVAAGAPKGKGSEAEVRAGEAGRIRERIPAGSRIWLLAREGKGMSSTQLARALGRAGVESVPGIAFVIGGAYGTDPSLAADADRRLSLSRLTLPHELARLFLAEQLYRSGTILRGEPYHKGGG